MNWDLSNLYIDATYLDIPVVGKVVLSRVAFGGRVKHTIVLDPPLKLSFSNELRDRLIVDHENVTRVRSNI